MHKYYSKHKHTQTETGIHIKYKYLSGRLNICKHRPMCKSMSGGV